MSADVPGLVETSTNVAVINTVDSEIELATSQRSSVGSEIVEIAETVASVFRLRGAEVSQGNGYPGWKPNLDSPFLEIARRTYQKLYGKEVRNQSGPCRSGMWDHRRALSGDGHDFVRPDPAGRAFA